MKTPEPNKLDADKVKEWHSELPVLIPEGYSVTVYGPDDYEGTFQGGEQW